MLDKCRKQGICCLIMTETAPQATAASPPGDDLSVLGVLLLEAFAVLLVHWRLLVVAPLIAGALGYAGSYLPQKSYRSYAYVGPLDEDAAARSAALLHSPAVLGPALRGLPEGVLSTIAADRREAYIGQRLQTQPNNAANPRLRQLYVIEAIDSDPSRAQAMLTSVVKAWVVALRPPPDRTASLERLKEAYEFQAATLGPDGILAGEGSGIA